MIRFVFIFLVSLLAVTLFFGGCATNPESIKNKQAVKLTKKLDDDDWQVRLEAVDELRWVGSHAAEATTLLLEALKDEHWELRERAAIVIGHIDPEPELVTALSGALSDKEPKVRYAVVGALHAYGPAAYDALPDLIAMLGDEAANVRNRAVSAISAMNPAIADIMPRLRDILQKSDTNARESAILMLSYLEPDEDIITLIIEETYNDRWQTRVIAVKGLGRVGAGYPDAISALINALDDENEKVRQYAAESLGMIGPVARIALPKLRELAENEESHAVRNAADKAVEKITTEEEKEEEGEEK